MKIDPFEECRRCGHNRAVHTEVCHSCGTCRRFLTPRPPSWRVECPGPKPINHGFLTLVGDRPKREWTVRSPAGVAVFRVNDRAAALQIGRSMAAIDEMLARITRLERNAFGNHPALKAPAAQHIQAVK